MADLDRAYVINGDDLRVALGEVTRKTLVPREVAERVLAEIEVRGATAVSKHQLTAAVRQLKITHAYNGQKDPEWIAALLLDAISAPTAHDASRDPWAGEHDVSSEPEPPAAHVCTGQCPADQELHAMAALLPALPLVSRLRHQDARRVMEWFTHRACDDLPPFRPPDRPPCRPSPGRAGTKNGER